MRETQYRAMQRIAALVGFAQAGRADAHALAGSLDVGCVLGPIASEHDCQAGHAFAADDADLDARFARAVCDDGRKPGFDEIDLVDALPASFERLPHRKIDGFQMRLKQREILTRQRRDRIRLDDMGHLSARLSANCQWRRRAHIKKVAKKVTVDMLKALFAASMTLCRRWMGELLRGPFLRRFICALSFLERKRMDSSAMTAISYRPRFKPLATNSVFADCPDQSYPRKQAARGQLRLPQRFACQGLH